MVILMDYFSNSRGWMYFLAPLLLGVLHGIEPRHSRLDHPKFESEDGLFWRPFLLGLAAAASHTLMIWIIATSAAHFGSHWSPGNAQPYLELASTALTLGMTVHSFIHWRREDLANPPAIQQGIAAHVDPESDRERLSTSHIMVSGAAIGMMPCPLTLGVLLACLQTGRLMLGMTLAACFGVGLAMSMATAGSVSAWFTRRARNWNLDIDGLRHRISFIFCVLLAILSCVMAWRTVSNFIRL